MSAAAFTKKDLLPPERVCCRLRALREDKKMSLEEMEKKTLIDKKYLQALEECRFKDLPKATVYQKNFVKSYVEALGLESEKYLEQYLIEEVVSDKKNKKCLKVKDAGNSRWNLLPTILRYVFLFGIVFVFIIYLGLQVKRIVEPPKLTVYSPVEGYITDKNITLVQGETEKEAEVTLNGKEIKNSENGQFKEEVGLSEGVNTFVITAKKKHGKTTTEVRHVVYKVDN